MDERALLLARMAADRARLLHLLIGVKTPALLSKPVFADWTAGNLLAHIGDFDRLNTYRVEFVLVGQLDQVIKISNLDAYNEELQFRIKDWPLDESVKYFEDWRTAFVNALRGVLDADLHRALMFTWGEVSIADWVEWRYKHDASHSTDIATWRDSLDDDDLGWQGVKPILLAAIRAARADLQATIALVPATERETLPVCGHWTLKDVVGHIADWSLYFHGCLALMLGQTPSAGWSPDADEVMNEVRVEARRNQSWIMTWADFNARYIALREAIDALDDEDLNRSRASDSPYDTIYACAWSSLEHDLDHAAVMRRELDIDVPDYLLHIEGPFTG